MKKITPCIVCKSMKSKYLYTTHDRMFDIPGSFDVKKCTSCGLQFIDPIPPAKILAEHYPTNDYYSYQGNEAKDFFSVLRSYLVKHYYEPTLISRIFSILVQNVPAMPTKRKGKILDLGCGTGDTLLLLKELGWDVYGLEIDKKAVAVAKERGLKNVKLGTYEGIATYPDNYFDAIRLYHVIEHLGNPSVCLNLIYKKLKPGGEVILGTPNVDSLASQIFGKYWYNLDIPRHLYIFSPKTLKMIAKKEKFEHIQIEFCSGGGLIRSINYFISDKLKKNFNFENHLWLFFLLYPFEWLLDKLGAGDIFILRAKTPRATG